MNPQKWIIKRYWSNGTDEWMWVATLYSGDKAPLAIDNRYSRRFERVWNLVWAIIDRERYLHGMGSR